MHKVDHELDKFEQKLPKNVGYLRNVHVTAQSYMKAPNVRKIAQSGHPAYVPT
jgi:hypothetical protein